VQASQDMYAPATLIPQISLQLGKLNLLLRLFQRRYANNISWIWLWSPLRACTYLL